MFNTSTDVIEMNFIHRDNRDFNSQILFSEINRTYSRLIVRRGFSSNRTRVFAREFSRMRIVENKKRNVKVEERVKDFSRRAILKYLVLLLNISARAGGFTERAKARTAAG